MLEKGHKRKSFSLAEVLVTLTIIGVVASMTIPPLVQSYQKQEYVTRLKKAYTTTNQALQQMATDMGCTGDLKCTGLFDSSAVYTDFGDALVSYINVAKNCKTAANQGCFASTTNTYYDGSYTGTNSTYDAEATYKFVTADAISFSIHNMKNNCITDGTGTSTNYSTGRTGNMKQVCALLRMDVNGPQKGPNYFGRDTFYFFVTNGKGPLLYPYGGADAGWNVSATGDYWWINPADGKTPRNCTKSSKAGVYCTGRIIEEGWEMNY